MFIDERKLMEEAADTLVPKLKEALNEILPPLVAQLKEILPGLKITIVIEREK